MATSRAPPKPAKPDDNIIVKLQSAQIKLTTRPAPQKNGWRCRWQPQWWRRRMRILLPRPSPESPGEGQREKTGTHPAE